MPAKLEAPLQKGDVICEAVVKQADREIMRIELVAAENVKRNLFLFAFGKLGEFTHTNTFRVFLAIVLLTAGVLIGVRAYANNNRRRRKIKTVNYRDVRK